MPQIGDFLNRFRPAGAPGAATRAGVPADRAAEISGELEPVLGLLAATDAECASLIAEAQREAARIAVQAREQAAAIAAGAVRDAAAARTAAAAEVLAAAQERAGQTERAAAAALAARSGPGDADVEMLIRMAVDLVTAMPEGTQKA